MKTVELPIFHLGTYKSSNGVPVTFTPELLRQLERNTNFVISQKALQPPVGYDHPAARDTNAHGRITGVRYENGKLVATIGGTSDQLREDAKHFRRLTYSPEFHEDFEYVDNGKPVKVGPTVIGLAMLGAQRGAIKNTAMIPLSEVNFGESVPAVEAMMIRAELRAMGYVGEYAVDGKFFGEVENDDRRFFREDKELPMTAEEKAEIQRMLDAQSEKHKADIAKLTSEFDTKIKSFSEEEKVRKERLDFCEAALADKPLGKSAAIALREFAADPSWEKGKALILALPAMVTKEKAKGGEGKDDEDEPKDLAKLTPKMFSDLDTNDAAIGRGLVAFAEHDPKAWAAVAKKPLTEQIAALKAHVIAREANAN